MHRSRGTVDDSVNHDIDKPAEHYQSPSDKDRAPPQAMPDEEVEAMTRVQAEVARARADNGSYQ